MRNSKKVDVNFNGRHIPNACDVSVRFVDLETAEVLYDGHKNVVFSCGLGDDVYIKSVIDSLVRGLQSGRSVYVEISAKQVHPDDRVPYIFHNIPSRF